VAHLPQQSINLLDCPASVLAN